MSEPGVYWSDDRLDELRRRWAAGETVTVIAAQMGTTRNSIIGKVHRLGLEGRPERNPSQRAKFQRLIDMVADAPLNHPVTLYEAAYRVGLDYQAADSLWGGLCATMGPLAISGDEHRPL